MALRLKETCASCRDQGLCVSVYVKVKGRHHRLPVCFSCRTAWLRGETLSVTLPAVIEPSTHTLIITMDDEGQG